MKITSSVMKLSMLKHLDISCNEIADEAAIRNQENCQCIEMYIIFAVSWY